MPPGLSKLPAPKPSASFVLSSAVPAQIWRTSSVPGPMSGPSAAATLRTCGVTCCPRPAPDSPGLIPQVSAPVQSAPRVPRSTSTASRVRSHVGLSTGSMAASWSARVRPSTRRLSWKPMSRPVPPSRRMSGSSGRMDPKAARTSASWRVPSGVCARPDRPSASARPGGHAGDAVPGCRPASGSNRPPPPICFDEPGRFRACPAPCAVSGLSPARPRPSPASRGLSPPAPAPTRHRRLTRPPASGVHAAPGGRRRCRPTASRSASGGASDGGSRSISGGTGNSFMA